MKDVGCQGAARSPRTAVSVGPTDLRDVDGDEVLWELAEPLADRMQ